MSNINAYIEFLQEILFNINQELIPYNIKATMDEQLENSNWQDIDEGSCAIVYESPCKKYVARFSYFIKDSYAYHVYNCLEMENNPFFQKIYWHAYYYQKIKGYAFQVTLMEKLEKIDYEERGLDIKHIHPDTYRQWVEEGHSAIPNDVRSFFRAEPHIHSGISPLQVQNPTKEFQEALEKIRTTKEQFNLWMDSQPVNFMFRGDQVVFVDPYANDLNVLSR